LKIYRNRKNIYANKNISFLGADAFKDNWGLEYPNDDEEFLPEYIMIPDINIEYASKHFLGKLRDKKVTGEMVYPEEDTWPLQYAYELTYWRALKNYNGGSIYPNSVFNYAKNNRPKKN